MFICFTTNAVHIEIVNDLTIQAFIADLWRFVGRRGLCQHIYSDNATNFVGSRNELIELQRLYQSENHQVEVNNYCIAQGMEWHMIPPRSPHFGGLWEAAVKSAKHHIIRTIGTLSYTFEQLHTLVVQVESCLNSRPLSPMSEDPSDMNCLTPGHFLIGQPLTALPDPTLQHLIFNRLSYFQRIQFVFQQFWKRWSREYLSELQGRKKWQNDVHNVKVGSMVLLHEDNLPPLKWVLGRIIHVWHGHDQKVRVVLVKTAHGEFKRAVQKISILPICNKEPEKIDLDEICQNKSTESN